MTVRIATPQDARAVEAVRVAGWQAAYGGIVPQSYLDRLVVDAARRRGLMRTSGATTLVAEVDGAVVGMAVHGPARDEDAAGLRELYALYVAPTAWRTGVGTALLIACELPDLVWVLEDNLRGRSFYASHGYQPDGHRKVVDLDGGVTEIRMVVKRG